MHVDTHEAPIVTQYCRVQRLSGKRAGPDRPYSKQSSNMRHVAYLPGPEELLGRA